MWSLPLRVLTGGLCEDVALVGRALELTPGFQVGASRLWTCHVWADWCELPVSRCCLVNRPFRLSLVLDLNARPCPTSQHGWMPPGLREFRCRLP